MSAPKPITATEMVDALKGVLLNREQPEGLKFCSFCGKSQKQVTILIAGPTEHICDECTDLCAEIVAKERKRRISPRMRDPFFAVEEWP